MTHHYIQAGDKAPEFTLKNQGNKKAAPLSLPSGRILLSFHPLAWTSICEIQMRTLEAKKSELDDLGVTAYGISVDSVHCKKAWAEAIAVHETNLMADFWPHGDIAKQYGLFLEELGVSHRANVLIGLDRTVEWIKVYDIPQVPDIEEIIGFIKSNS